VPSHLFRIRGDDPRKHGVTDRKPVRAEPAPVEELDPKARCRPHSQLLADLAGCCLLIGLTDSRSTPDPEFVVPWETGQVLSPPMDEKTAWPIAAHHHANPVQPALPDGLPPADHSQHPVLSIDTFHEFIHDAHGPRHH
jgi:hypothetical protein